MRIPTDIRPKEASKLLPSFRSIVDWDALKKRGEVAHEISERSPLLGQYYTDTFHLELSLLDLFKYRRLTGRIKNPASNADTYDALTFIALFCGIHRHLSTRGKTELTSRFGGALKGSNNLASIDHELSVAGYLMRKGWDVEFVDLEKAERFDFIVTRDRTRLELECKNISGDHGRKVHRFEFYRFANMFRSAIRRLPAGRSLVQLLTIELPDRLLPDDVSMGELCQQAVSVFQSEAPRYESGSCRITQVIVTELKDEAAIQHVVDEFLSTNDNKIIFNVGPTGETHVGVRVKSAKRDQVLAYMYKQLKHAHRQFSGRGPAVIWANVQEIEPASWSTLRSGSSLQVMSSRFLSSPERSHVVSLAYHSYGEVVRTKNYVSESGPVLHYDNDTSPFFEPALKRLYQ